MTVILSVAVLFGLAELFNRAPEIWLRHFVDHRTIITAADRVFREHPFYRDLRGEGEYMVVRLDDPHVPSEIRELRPTWIHLFRDHLVLMFGGGFEDDPVTLTVYRPTTAGQPRRLTIR